MIGIRLATAAILSLAFSTPAAAQPASQRIVLWSFGIAPKPIQLAAGERVALTFENRAGSSHDFVARSFFANSRIISGDVMDGMVDLRGHQVKSVVLIPRAGTYEAHCDHFLHAPLGMTSTIIVH